MDDAETILSSLTQDYGQLVTLVTQNAEAEEIVQSLNWKQYFTHIVAYDDDGTDKRTHLEKALKLHADTPIESFVFCDDVEANIRTARVLGIQNTIHCSYLTGLSWDACQKFI